MFTVLSALVGQAMAVDTMSFEMAIDNKHYNSNSESNCSTNMSHGMRVDSSSSENASIKDCCNTSECTCPPGGCTHAPVLIASMIPKIMKAQLDKLGKRRRGGDEKE